jgi:hypothetical protein
MVNTNDSNLAIHLAGDLRVGGFPTASQTRLSGTEFQIACCLAPLICGLLILLQPARAAGAQYSIKQAKSPLPKELQPAIQKLLGDSSIQLLDDKGALVCEIWFRKELPAKATPEQVKNGLTYRDLSESTLVGAVRFDRPATDYRKQMVNPGVYTLRLGFQPMDGDHMGTAPYPNFCLILPASLDQKPDPIDTKDLRDESAKSVGGSHPGVFLLYPADKPEAAPTLVAKPSDTWVLTWREPVALEGQKEPASMGFGLTLVGHTAAE